jgi:NADH-quinone oxidoreductase subunit J
MVHNFQFFILSSLLLSSYSLFFATNVVHSLLFLILVFINAAIILMIEQLEFLSLLLLIIYVGAVAVLFLFIIMMLNIKNTSINWELKANFLIFFLIIFVVGSIVIFPFFSGQDTDLTGFNSQNFLIDSLTNLDVFGQVLYNNYLIAVFLGGLVLLIAVVGAIILTLSFKKVYSTSNNDNHYNNVNL